jgi:hypothetical protein
MRVGGFGHRLYGSGSPSMRYLGRPSQLSRTQIGTDTYALWISPSGHPRGAKNSRAMLSGSRKDKTDP